MKIQFNLIPDIKFEYLKAKRLEQMVILGSVVFVGLIVIVVGGLIVWTQLYQGNKISDLSSKIDSSAAQIKKIDGLDKIITIQTQLNTLPGLYEQDPRVSRVFSFLVKMTPPSVTIGDLSLDLTQNTLEIKGTAPALKDINALADTLKQTTFDNRVTEQKGQPAFSDVVLTSFGRSDKDASYTIDLTFDASLFAAGVDNDISLSVPQTTNLPQVPGVNGQIFKAMPTGSTGSTGGQQ